MSLTRLPAELRRRAACAHTFQPIQQQRRQASILFALSALSNSRETQHFNKATKLSRVEHSPALQLIKSSEVDPFKAAGPVKRDVSSVSDGTVKVADLAGEGAKAGHHAAAQQSSNEAAIASPAGSALPPSSSGAGGDGNGKKPPSGTEAAAVENSDISDKEALKIGRAFLGEHVQDKRKLRQELKEARAELEQLRNEAERRAKEDFEREESAAAKKHLRRESIWNSFWTYAWIFSGIAAWLFYKYEVPIELVNARINSLKTQLEKAKAQIPSVQEQLENEWNASKVKKLEAAEKEAQALKALMEAEGKVLMDYYEKNKAYEAKMADWTRKAEELKQAVERKDVRSLSRAEQTAYLEALVFLGVKDKPKRRWWKGLFWSQE